MRWGMVVAVGWMAAACGRAGEEGATPDGAVATLPAEGANAKPQPLPLPDEAQRIHPCPEFDRDGVIRCTSYRAPVDAVRTVIRDEAAWAAFWRAAFSHLRDAPSLPRVDFTRELLLVASGGLKPSTGYFLYFRPQQDPATAEVVELEPGPDCTTLMVMTIPWAVKRVPRAEAAVKFVEVRGAYRCGP